MSQVEVHYRSIKKEAIEQVEDTADARQETAGVFYARFALKYGFDEIPDYGAEAEQKTKNERVQGCQARHVLLKALREQNARAG